MNAEDKKMIANGMTHKAEAWIHPEYGDDYAIDIYFNRMPNAAEVRRILINKGSELSDDFRIVSLIETETKTNNEEKGESAMPIKQEIEILTMEKLGGLKMKELVAYINGLVATKFYRDNARDITDTPFPSGPPLSDKAFSNKAKAISRIEAIHEHVDLIREKLEADADASDAPEASDAKPSKPKGRTIKSLADELILVVVDKEEFTGLPYLDILAKIKAEFPEANTTVNCLRWYASKLQADHRVPSRPRKKK